MNVIVNLKRVALSALSVLGVVGVALPASASTIDSAFVGSTTQAFITSFTTVLTDNIGIVLAFAAGIMVWHIAKKYVFGGARRV